MIGRDALIRYGMVLVIIAVLTAAVTLIIIRSTEQEEAEDREETVAEKNETSSMQASVEPDRLIIPDEPEFYLKPQPDPLRKAPSRWTDSDTAPYRSRLEAEGLYELFLSEMELRLNEAFEPVP
ncbi:MAG: hypothetical protein K9L68_02485 [Spirochaetales bacterium]|nr:hypothetical protein [Spirochaetales bacterium]MCF7937444.1 hypothetical protein [Spirochaetales bacterium]